VRIVVDGADETDFLRIEFPGGGSDATDVTGTALVDFGLEGDLVALEITHPPLQLQPNGERQVAIPYAEVHESAGAIYVRIGENLAEGSGAVDTAVMPVRLAVAHDGRPLLAEIRCRLHVVRFGAGGVRLQRVLRDSASENTHPRRM
jgi:hypothetical protein